MIACDQNLKQFRMKCFFLSFKFDSFILSLKSLSKRSMWHRNYKLGTVTGALSLEWTSPVTVGTPGRNKRRAGRGRQVGQMCASQPAHLYSPWQPCDSFKGILIFFFSELACWPALLTGLCGSDRSDGRNCASGLVPVVWDKYLIPSSPHQQWGRDLWMHLPMPWCEFGDSSLRSEAAGTACLVNV